MRAENAIQTNERTNKMRTKKGGEEEKRRLKGICR
jgi:hypothetical protein